MRLLPDDDATPGLDPELAEPNAPANVGIRLFNPFVPRNPRVASLLPGFTRLNRRMHDKTFSVDGVATILAGAISPTSISPCQRGELL